MFYDILIFQNKLAATIKVIESQQLCFLENVPQKPKTESILNYHVNNFQKASQ